MMWHDFYAAGGWGMFPTTIVGFFLVASGVLLALRPERRFIPLVITLGLLTLVTGLLGSCVGIINTLHYAQTIAPAEQLKIVLIGCAESLNNLVLSLLLLGPTLLLTIVGVSRGLRRPAAN